MLSRLPAAVGSSSFKLTEILSEMACTYGGMSRHELDEVFRIIAGFQNLNSQELLLLLNSGVHEDYCYYYIAINNNNQ